MQRTEMAPGELKQIMD